MHPKFHKNYGSARFLDPMAGSRKTIVNGEEYKRLKSHIKNLESLDTCFSSLGQILEQRCGSLNKKLGKARFEKEYSNRERTAFCRPGLRQVLLFRLVFHKRTLPYEPKEILNETKLIRDGRYSCVPCTKLEAYENS